MASKNAAKKSPKTPENAEQKNRPMDTRVGRAVTLTWKNEKEIDGELKEWRSIEQYCLYVDKSKAEDDPTRWQNGEYYAAGDVTNAKASMEQALFDHHGGVDREMLGTMRAAVSQPRESHQPLKISCGAVEGLIWENEREDGAPWYSFQHSCRYRKDGEMHQGKSYGRIEGAPVYCSRYRSNCSIGKTDWLGGISSGSNERQSGRSDKRRVRQVGNNRRVSWHNIAGGRLKPSTESWNMHGRRTGWNLGAKKTLKPGFRQNW